MTDDEIMRGFTTLAAEHPLVTDGTICGRCLKGFEAGQYVTLDLLPPEDPEQKERMLSGRLFRTEGLPVHWSCATGEQERPSQLR